MKGKFSVKQKQSVQWLGISIVIFAIVLLTTDDGIYINDALMKVNDDEIFFIGTDFENQADGDLIHEGTLVFTGNIHSEGKFGCGICNSGASYIRNNLGDFQTVSGSGKITMHDVVLENEDGVDLELEWQVTNSLDFSGGIIRTDRDFGKDAYVHFLENAVSVNPDDAHHVDGYVAKSGIGSFILPTGDGARLLPVQITGNVSSSKFKAAYYNSDPNIGATYVGGPFPTTEYDIFELTYVSSDGFWDIEGNTTTQISLSWDATSNLSSWTSSLDSLAIVAWNGNEWVSLGYEETKGDLEKGTITSRSVIPDEYEAFTLGRRTPGIQPVDLLTFDAVQKGDDGYLFWTTAKEVNTFYFDVERSLDAVIFEKFGLVEAAGNSNSSIYYDFWDEGVALRDLDRIFYRIRQVDLDGQFIYSQIEELVFGDGGEEIDLVIFPNPVVDVVTIRYVAREALQARLKIFNMLGQIVHEEPVALTGSGDKKIPLTHLSTGHYIVVLGNQDIQISQKMIITH